MDRTSAHSSAVTGWTDKRIPFRVTIMFCSFGLFFNSCRVTGLVNSWSALISTIIQTVFPGVLLES